MLFGWSCENIRNEDKPTHYYHLYSYSSVKSVVHWFQFMQHSRFQMYDDRRWRAKKPDAQSYVQPGYPLSQIRCPIALFYGGRDTLQDTEKLIKELPKSTFVHEEPSYEHIDFLFADCAKEKIYPKIIELCQTASNRYASNMTPGTTPPHRHIYTGVRERETEAEGFESTSPLYTTQ